jgi:hypothetical protein
LIRPPRRHRRRRRSLPFAPWTSPRKHSAYIWFSRYTSSARTRTLTAAAMSYNPYGGIRPRVAVALLRSWKKVLLTNPVSSSTSLRGSPELRLLPRIEWSAGHGPATWSWYALVPVIRRRLHALTLDCQQVLLQACPLPPEWRRHPVSCSPIMPLKLIDQAACLLPFNRLRTYPTSTSVPP